MNVVFMITDAERSMNFLKNSVLDLLHLFCCLLRQCPQSTPMPHHYVKHVVLRRKWN